MLPDWRLNCVIEVDRSTAARSRSIRWAEVHRASTNHLLYDHTQNSDLMMKTYSTWPIHAWSGRFPAKKVIFRSTLEARTSLQVNLTVKTINWLGQLLKRNSYNRLNQLARTHRDKRIITVTLNPRQTAQSERLCSLKSDTISRHSFVFLFFSITCNESETVQTIYGARSSS